MSSTPFTLSKVGIADNTPTTKHKTNNIISESNFFTNLNNWINNRVKKAFLSQLVIFETVMFHAKVGEKFFYGVCMFRDTA